MSHAGGIPSLLERESVLGALSDHLAASVRGEGRLVLLHGEAGVGKSSVLERFAESAASCATVLRGWCDPLSTPRPLGPWADLAPDLGASVDLELRANSGELSGLLRAVLAALASPERVLVFEDLHWADKATLDMLRLLVRRIARLPTLVVATYRDDELSVRHPLRVLLGDLAGARAVYRHPIEPLSREGVAELAAGCGLDIAELYRATGGNPFFVTEVVAAGEQSIPVTVGDAVAGRLSRLSDSAVRAVQLIAAVGPSAPTGLLTGLCPDGALDELLDSGMLIALGGSVGFRHELARMAVLDGVPEHVRGALHAQVLEVLRRDPGHDEDTALLAHHAERAGDAAAVLEYAPHAAERAAASGAHHEAAAQYARALRFGADLPSPERAALLERFARSSHMADQLTEALEALREAAELWRRCGQALREGAALRLLSGLSVPAGRAAEARSAGEHAVRVLEALPPSAELASAYVNMAELAAYFQLGVEATAAYAQRAQALGSDLGDAAAVLQARFALELSRYLTEDIDLTPSAWAELERIRGDAQSAGFTDAAAFMTMLQATYAPLHWHHKGADSAYRRLDELARDRDLQLYLRVASAHRILSLLHRGSWDAAAEQATMLLGQAETPPISRVGPLVVQGLLRARRGDPDVEQPLDEALALMDTSLFPALAPIARAEAAWLRGDDESARCEAYRGLDAVKSYRDPWSAGALTRLIVIAGGIPPPVRAARPFALEIAGEWQAAAELWERLGCPYDAALARLRGDVPALMVAHETFSSLGARPAADRVRTRLKALGVRTGLRGPRRSTRANPHGLTARQMEIVDLVADGLTDSQIAARLHLSAKTVNHHVTAVLAKLDVHSRAEAVRKVERFR